MAPRQWHWLECCNSITEHGRTARRDDVGAGQHAGMTSARDFPYKHFLRGLPQHRMLLDTDTNRGRLSYPTRGWPSDKMCEMAYKRLLSGVAHSDVIPRIYIR
ncbi:hypothetical protein EVAR_98890_1 [Eumeta japonica]|uniref:Uncharacterized protein n=1 Tax=Eumeta variegata TaxID=151549 RepID=A0A4C1Y675_EUMVA|nr:hypothetical protein EVAR_98890_1 [Eumeta japonica]